MRPPNRYRPSSTVPLGRPVNESTTVECRCGQRTDRGADVASAPRVGQRPPGAAAADRPSRPGVDHGLRHPSASGRVPECMINTRRCARVSDLSISRRRGCLCGTAGDGNVARWPRVCLFTVPVDSVSSHADPGSGGRRAARHRRHQGPSAAAGSNAGRGAIRRRAEDPRRVPRRRRRRQGVAGDDHAADRRGLPRRRDHPLAVRRRRVAARARRSVRFGRTAAGRSGAARRWQVSEPPATSPEPSQTRPARRAAVVPFP